MYCTVNVYANEGFAGLTRFPNAAAGRGWTTTAGPMPAVAASPQHRLATVDSTYQLSCCHVFACGG